MSAGRLIEDLPGDAPGLMRANLARLASVDLGIALEDLREVRGWPGIEAAPPSEGGAAFDDAIALVARVRDTLRTLAADAQARVAELPEPPPHEGPLLSHLSTEVTRG